MNQIKTYYTGPSVTVVVCQNATVLCKSVNGGNEPYGESEFEW